MLPVVKGIKIDNDVAIPCPVVNFQNRRAAKCCPTCEHFRGLGQMIQGKAPWHKRYAIRCGHTMERRTLNIKVIEE